MIYSDNDENEKCLQQLINIFGRVDLVSKEYPFEITDYYENELGAFLKRKFVSFDRLIEPQQLAEIKRLTNIIESKYSTGQKRKVNLDPGYLDMDKFILASAKYGRQKIYLDKGIYADPTLYFYNKKFHSYSWSFPDFSSGVYDSYFIQVRNLYKQQIRRS